MSGQPKRERGGETRENDQAAGEEPAPADRDPKYPDQKLNPFESSRTGATTDVVTALMFGEVVA